MLDELERIKGVGDKNPDMALSMLDSLELEIRGENVILLCCVTHTRILTIFNILCRITRRLLRWQRKNMRCAKV